MTDAREVILRMDGNAYFADTGERALPVTWCRIEGTKGEVVEVFAPTPQLLANKGMKENMHIGALQRFTQDFPDAVYAGMSWREDHITVAQALGVPESDQ